MMYLDCDLILKTKQPDFFNSDALCFTSRKKRPGTNKEHLIITEKYIPNINIDRYVQAGAFCINKDHCFNLKEILNLKDNATEERTKNSPPITNKISPKITQSKLMKNNFQRRYYFHSFYNKN